MRFFLPVALLILAGLPAGLAQEESEWPAGKFNPYGRAPIRVFLDVANLSEDATRYAGEAREAMAYWERGGNGALAWAVSFEETRAAGEADVLVWFVDADEVDCDGEPAAGCGGFGVPGHPGEVWLALRQAEAPVGGPLGGSLARPSAYRPYGDLRALAKHELGHALGLEHSERPGDVMYPTGHAAPRGESPDSLLSRGQLWMALGICALGLVSAAGMRWMRFRGSEDVSAAEPAAPARSVEARQDGNAIVQTQPYLRGIPRCPAVTSGEHKYETRRAKGADGVEETWNVCVLCRHPRRL